MAKPGDNYTYGFGKFDAGALVKLIGNEQQAYQENRPRGGGGGGGQKLFATPSGGIPAASGSPPGTVTVPAALCTEYDWQTTGTFAAIPTANTSLVYNITDQTIAGNVLIKAARVKGYWVVDTASCGASGQGFQNWT